MTQSNPSSTETPTPTSGPAIVKTVNKTSFPVGAIAGIVVALVLILACGGLLYYKKGWKRKDTRPDTPELEAEKPEGTELAADAPYPKFHREVEDNPDSYYGKKEAVETSASSIPPGMDTPRLESGDVRVYVEGSQTITELPGEAVPRSELSSPEPPELISRQASPTPNDIAELSNSNPSDYPWFYPEMATSAHSPHISPPSEETYSALSSPRIPPRPQMGSRRPASQRLSSTASDESGLLPIQLQETQRSGNFSKDGTPNRPPHGRKDSDESGFTQDTFLTRRPSQFAQRKDSTESGVTLDNIPGGKQSFHKMNTSDSDPLMSPKALPSHPFTSRESTMETRMEEDIDSDPEVGAAELVRRGSAQLINQMSPPASPSKKSIPRKEVASPSSQSHPYPLSRQDSSGPPSAFSSPRLESSGFTGHMRSSSRGSRFSERFTDDVPEGNLDSKKS